MIRQSSTLRRRHRNPAQIGSSTSTCVLSISVLRTLQREICYGVLRTWYLGARPRSGPHALPHIFDYHPYEQVCPYGVGLRCPSSPIDEATIFPIRSTEKSSVLSHRCTADSPTAVRIIHSASRANTSTSTSTTTTYGVPTQLSNRWLGNQRLGLNSYNIHSKPAFLNNTAR